jgi:hypothetical protein
MMRAPGAMALILWACSSSSRRVRRIKGSDVGVIFKNGPTFRPKVKIVSSRGAYKHPRTAFISRKKLKFSAARLLTIHCIFI